MASIKNEDQTKREQMGPHRITAMTKVISRHVIQIYFNIIKTKVS